MGVVELATGLDNVPKADGQTGQGTRAREVWTNDERRKLDHLAKMIKGHGDLFFLKCGSDLCPDRTIALVAEASAPRGAVLRCGCTDRVFSKA